MTIHIGSGRMPESKCPSCGETLSAATGIAKDEIPVPEPGNFTFCAYCGGLAVFTEGLELRFPTQQEREAAFRTVKELFETEGKGHNV